MKQLQISMHNNSYTLTDEAIDYASLKLEGDTYNSVNNNPCTNWTAATTPGVPDSDLDISGATPVPGPAAVCLLGVILVSLAGASRK